MSEKEKAGVAEQGKAQGNGGVMDANQFREQYIKGEEVVSPRQRKYTVRPVSPMYFLGAGLSQLHTVKEKIDVAVDSRLKATKDIKEGKQPSEEVLVEVAKKEREAMKSIPAVKAAMTPVLVEGMVSPKVVEDASKRKDGDNTITVDELMSQFDEAAFLYSAIINLSTKGESTGDMSFPAGEKESGTGA